MKCFVIKTKKYEMKLCILVMIFLVFSPFYQGKTVGTITDNEDSENQSISNWVELHPTSGPWQRSGPELMVYDIESSKTILFSGITPIAVSGTNYVSYNGTWTFDYATTTWTNQSPSVSPVGRFSRGSAYDAESDRMIIFGGGTALGGSYGEAPPETWAYDTNTNTWTNMSPNTAPNARLDCYLVYDFESDRVILYGGVTKDMSNSGDPFYDDTWAYDYNTNTWEQMNPNTSPPKVIGYGFAYDVESDRVILFGGTLGNSEPKTSRYKDETWAYDYNTDSWKQIITTNAPSPRVAYAMTYDNESDRIILFGGSRDVLAIPDEYEDTWAFDYNSATWTDMNPPTHATQSSSLVYDYSADKIILFGGSVIGSPTYYLNETWAYHYQLNPPSAPLKFNATIVEGEVSLTWDSPATDAGSTITNYLIYRGTESSSLTLLTTLGVVSEYVDASVDEKIEYYYAISAKNALGEGTLSGEIMIDLSSKPAPGFAILITASVLGLIVFLRKKRK